MAELKDALRWQNCWLPMSHWLSFFAVLTLGGIAFMNTWDFPFYLALIAATLVYRRYLEDGWNGKRIIEFFLELSSFADFKHIDLPAILFKFASQAGGILPSLAFFYSWNKLLGHVCATTRAYLFFFCCILLSRRKLSKS